MKILKNHCSALESVRLMVASSPSVYRRILIDSGVPGKLRAEMISGTVREPEVREFVETLMSDFREGSQFVHERFIAALAIACETIYSKFSDEFPNDLANLKLAEMPMAIRVARYSLELRRVKMSEIRAGSFEEAVTYEPPATFFGGSR